MRLMFENSTVCLIVDELVCFASVGHGCAVLLAAFLVVVGWCGLWLMVSLVEDDDSGIFFVRVCFCRVEAL